MLVTHLDAARLEQVLQQERELSSSERRAALARELEKAAIVDARAIPPNVVTMNSQVVCEDEKTRVRHTVKLVYPAIKRAQNPGLSVLSPLGTALLGLSLGALIELPRGHRSAGPLRVRALPYQPERHGDFHL